MPLLQFIYINSMIFDSSGTFVTQPISTKSGFILVARVFIFSYYTLKVCSGNSDRTRSFLGVVYIYLTKLIFMNDKYKTGLQKRIIMPLLLTVMVNAVVLIRMPNQITWFMRTTQNLRKKLRHVTMEILNLCQIFNRVVSAHACLVKVFLIMSKFN